MCFKVGDILVTRKAVECHEYRVVAIVPDAAESHRLVTVNTTTGCIVVRYENGLIVSSGESNMDLIKKKTKKSKTVYLNLYRDMVCQHDTEHEAKSGATSAALKVAVPYTYEWEE